MQKQNQKKEEDEYGSFVEWYWQGKAEVLRDKHVTVRDSPGSKPVHRDERPAANGWDVTLLLRSKWHKLYTEIRCLLFERNDTAFEWQIPISITTYMFGSGIPYFSPWHKSAPSVCWGTDAKFMNSPFDKNRASEIWTCWYRQ